jgi:hypothetical protein
MESEELMMSFTVEIYKADRRFKTGERFIGKYNYDRKDRAAMDREATQLRRIYKESDGYRFNIVETLVTRTNILTGETFHERYDTPSYCSPSSEAYWSM